MLPGAEICYPKLLLPAVEICCKRRRKSHLLTKLLLKGTSWGSLGEGLLWCAGITPFIHCRTLGPVSQLTCGLVGWIALVLFSVV